MPRERSAITFAWAILKTHSPFTFVLFQNLITNGLVEVIHNYWWWWGGGVQLTFTSIIS